MTTLGNRVQKFSQFHPIIPSCLVRFQGIYPIKPQLPCVGGFEGVGEVTEVGGHVTEVKLGDRVIPAMGTLGKPVLVV